MAEVNQELQERMDALKKELVPLLTKFEFDLGAEAFLTPDGRITAIPRLVDLRKQAEEPASTVTAPVAA